MGCKTSINVIRSCVACHANGANECSGEVLLLYHQIKLMNGAGYINKLSIHCSSSPTISLVLFLHETVLVCVFPSVADTPTTPRLLPRPRSVDKTSTG